MSKSNFQCIAHEAKTRGDISQCYTVMRQLRPDYTHDAFVQRVIEQQAGGYRLAYLIIADTVVAVAGFRIINNLAWGKFLYVDDLVTDEHHRSKEYGKELLNWLRNEARRLGCSQLHLDSGVQRTDAHRFYSRESMAKTCYHYAENL